MTIPHAAGAMYSTVEDLLKWDQALYTERLLPKSALDRMFEPFKDNYAYGWVVGDHKGRTRIAHGGGINGFATFIARYPNERLTVITLANLENAQSGKLAEELALIAFGETVEPPRQRTAILSIPKSWTLAQAVTSFGLVSFSGSGARGISSWSRQRVSLPFRCSPSPRRSSFSR